MAGPASNLIMAIIAAALSFVLYQVFFGMSVGATTGTVVSWAITILYFFTLINLVLMFFNLLPIPPLDGSSLIVPFLSRKALPTWYQIQRYALPIFFVVVFALPYFLNFSPISIYLDFTAGNLSRLLFPYF